MHHRGLRYDATIRVHRVGVSPIVATVLLVAMTVVFAAVLYILLTSYLGDSNSTPPKTIQFSNPTFYKGPVPTGAGGACSNPGVASYYIVSFSSVVPSPGLDVSTFGMKIIDHDTGTNVPYDCAILEGSNNLPLCTYNPANMSWTDNTIVPTGGGSMLFLTGNSANPSANLHGTLDTIEVFGTGSAMVSGGFFQGL